MVRQSNGLALADKGSIGRGSHLPRTTGTEFRRFSSVHCNSRQELLIIVGSSPRTTANCFTFWPLPSAGTFFQLLALVMILEQLLDNIAYQLSLVVASFDE